MPGMKGSEINAEHTGQEHTVEGEQARVKQAGEKAQVKEDGTKAKNEV